MLRDEPNRTYYVYPSWADLSYRWEDLPRLLTDPLHSGCFKGEDRAKEKTKMQFWLDAGYPPEIKPATLIDGPAGGGIIHVDSVYPEKWLPANILNKEGNLCACPGFALYRGELPFHVRYIEPHSSPEWAIMTGKKPKLYLCGGVTVEHIEANPDYVYWLIVYKKSKRRLKSLDDVPGWAESFGVKAVELDSVPQRIAEETSDWVVDPQWESTWFSIQSNNDLVGYHLAIALYMGMHLKSVERRMKTIHVVSALETPMNIRKGWYRR